MRRTDRRLLFFVYRFEQMDIEDRSDRARPHSCCKCITQIKKPPINGGLYIGFYKLSCLFSGFPEVTCLSFVPFRATHTVHSATETNSAAGLVFFHITSCAWA